ncbi:MAG: restriction endonuclease subunit S [Alphaproteobacteria bacterium]|nr:restriction endonuclease subunit S [Alphaproteobacteria bacterium]
MKQAPYPEYKNAGVSWIGSVPAHWPEKRAKYYFKEIDERSQTGEEEMLSVSHITGVTPRSQKNVTMFKAETNVGQKLCQPGDLVINTMWAWMSALGVSNHDGIVSPAYGVYRPRNRRDYDDYYLDHLLRIEGYRSEYICRSTGIRSSRLRLYPDKFLSMRVVCPPQDEQQAIVRFLKAQNRLFLKFIRNKRRLIDLLKEQKQNVINKAVTRGIDPNVKLKPSGVEWIGDIPEHWTVAPLKHLAIINARVLSESTDENYTFKYFDIGSVGTGDLTREPEKIRFGQAPSRARRIIKKGDTIISTVRTYLKAVYHVVDEVDDWIASTGFAVLTPRKEMHAPFLGLLIQSDSFINRVIRESVGVAYPAIAETELGALHLSYPGSFEEQKAILEHIAETSKSIDRAITRAHREIELMREYRTRLISDVVTGQVDVRGIAVPEVAEEELLALEEEAVADADDVIDDEGDMGDAD